MDEPVYWADIKKVLRSGKLVVYRDRTEYVTSSVQKAVFNYAGLVAIKKEWDRIDFITEDGRKESCPADRKCVHEAFLYIEQMSRPYLAQRKDRLLSQGVRYSFPSSQGVLNDGILNISAGQAEFKARSGRNDVIPFQDIREAGLYTGMLELALTDGRSRSFTVDRDVENEVLAFVRTAIEPYVAARTVGFDTTFGIDERIEINSERGVFHIIRQGGREISEEWPLEALARCEWVENRELNALGSVVSGGLSLFRNAAKAAGNQAVTEKDRISCAGISLTIQTGQGFGTQTVWFGIFPTGMGRTNKKYERYLAEWPGLSDYLRERCPACEQVQPVPPEAAPEIAAGAAGMDIAGTAAAEAANIAESVARQDDLGIAKYLDGVSRFIGNCSTPMTIAFQGNRGSGENSVLKMLFNRMRDNVTPEFVSGLCGHPSQSWGGDETSDDEKAAFLEFGSVFARILDQDHSVEISEEECRAFAEVLLISSITSR